MASEERDRRRHGLWARVRRRLLGRYARLVGGKPKVELPTDIVITALLAMLLLLGGLVGLTLYQQGRIAGQQTSITKAQRDINDNQRRLDRQQRMLGYLERRDRINSYQTAFRFCRRINVDRAVVHYYLGRGFGLRTLQRLEERGGDPILDCDPNVTGNPARYIGPLEQRKFVRRWRDNHLTPVEIGICRIRIGTLKDPRTCIN
jgi:hypothetical protein